jgi:hypothetical protein
MDLIFSNKSMIRLPNLNIHYAHFHLFCDDCSIIIIQSLPKQYRYSQICLILKEFIDGGASV